MASNPSATFAALPTLARVPARSSLSSKNGDASGKTNSTTTPGPTTTATPSRMTTAATPGTLDPASLLDSLDAARNASMMMNPSKSESGNAASASSSSSSFDPIEFLNRHYTSEAMLVTHLPGLREAVAQRMERLDDRISTALQRQSETAPVTRKHVQDAKASVIALEARVRQVQEKALQSERAVIEITKDMKRLDCAKRHLQRTITTLKRLHMLVHAVEQLRWSCQQQPFPDYPTAAHLIEAIRLLLAHFDAYTQKVQPMRLLSHQVSTYQEELRIGLVKGFRVVGFGLEKARHLMQQDKTPNGSPSKAEGVHVSSDIDDGTHIMTPQAMQGGILVLDALGSQVREQFTHEFCQDHLSDYLTQFRPPSREPPKQEKRVSSFKVVEVKSEPEPTPAGLENLEKRFAWFRDVVANVESKFPKVFPPEWNLLVALCTMFLQLTRDHLLALLDGPRKDPEAGNATILLKALQKTILFEKDITTWLQREHGVVFEKDGENTPQDASEDAEVTPTVKPVMGIASGAFESYMSPYIRLEEQSMDEQLASALDDKTVDTRGDRPVYISSTNLFVYIKGSITRCTALTKGHAFFLLYQSFKKSLTKYAQIMEKKLPSPATGPNLVGIVIPGSFGGGKNSNNYVYKLETGEEESVCYVVNTCEYCVDTMDALQDLIRDTIDRRFEPKIDMSPDQEVFHEVAATCLRVLVSGLTNRLDAALKNMLATNWGAWDVVGEESAYVQSIHDEIEPFAVRVRQLLPTSYFRSFCDKFCLTFSSTYYNTLIRLKRISEPGTQQLLLDVYSLKTLFLKIPVLEKTKSPGKKPITTGSTIAPAMYTKMVQKQFGKIETLLKLVGTPQELLLDNFKVQWVGGTSLDLQNVMVLKGMKRNEQTAMLEKFGVDPVTALMKGSAGGVADAALERVQALQDQGSNVAAKVNSDLNQMRQKVDDFRKQFRSNETKG